MKLILRTMLAELTPRVSRPWQRLGGELTRRRAITMVPMGGARVVWEQRRGR